MRECKEGCGLGQDMVCEDTRVESEFDLGQIFPDSTHPLKHTFMYKPCVPALIKSQMASIS